MQGSFDGPVAYLRNGIGCPWCPTPSWPSGWDHSGLGGAQAGEGGHIALLTFPGRHGMVIYLQNYLSTMFQICDVMVDKDEVAMCLNIRIALPTSEPKT